MNKELLEINNNIPDVLNHKSFLKILKPILYKKNNDIDLKSVFKIMNIKNENEIYNEQFKNINIILNEEQSQKRYDIIMTIKKFIIENEINANIFYYIIYLFDLLIIKNNKYKLISSLEKIGLGALFISIKFFHENNNNVTIGNKKYKSLYNNRYYSMHEIIKLEVLCLKLINYCLTRPSVINFIELFITVGILYDSDLNNNSTNSNNNYNDTFNHLYYLIFKNLDFIVLYSNEYIKYNPFYLSCFIIGLSRNILNMEKYPKQFSKFFKLTKANFNEIYNELWQKLKNILNNKNKDKRNNTKNNYFVSQYLRKHLKEVESQSFLHVKKNLNYYYNLEILNSEINQNLSCRKDNNAHYINPFLDRKVSLKHKKQNTYENNNIKQINKYENKNYSSQAPAPLHKILKNCSNKVKNLYKFNPSLFSEYINSSSNNNNINTLVKFKTSHCFQKSNDKIEHNGHSNLKDNKEIENKNLENSRENKKGKNISKKFIKNRTAIKFVFKDNDNNDNNNNDNHTNNTNNNTNNINDNDSKLKKEEKNIYIEESNFKRYKFIKSKSSLNWKFVKNRQKEREERAEKEEKEEINQIKNEKEEINQIKNEKEKEKNKNYFISIRRSYKKKKKNNCNPNIHINRINNINKYNIHTENDSKNEEEKNMNIFSFKRKFTEKIEKKINNEQFCKNNGEINQIINDNKSKLSKMANKFEDINNKRVHIRMFYKLKNSSLKNGKKYNYA